MRRFHFTRWVVLCGIFPSLLACAGELDGDPASYIVGQTAGTGGGSGAGGGGSQVCDALPVFKTTCGSSFCHGVQTKAEGLDFESDGLSARLVGVAAQNPGCETRKLIDPASYDRSFIIEKLTADKPQCGDHMPLLGDLSDSDLKCIEDWVRARVTGTSAPSADAG